MMVHAKWTRLGRFLQGFFACRGKQVDVEPLLEHKFETVKRNRPFVSLFPFICAGMDRRWT